MAIYDFDSNVNLVGGEHKLQAQSARKSLFVQICLQAASPKVACKASKDMARHRSEGTASRGYRCAGYYFAGGRSARVQLFGVPLRGGTASRECRMATSACRGAASWAADADQKNTLFFNR